MNNEDHIVISSALQIPGILGKYVSTTWPLLTPLTKLNPESLLCFQHHGSIVPEDRAALHK
jgi:hypothetical protein